ncbi:MAG: alpha/beta hydrolase, partial [Brevundimonas sp.]
GPDSGATAHPMNRSTPATFERIEGAEHMVMIDQPTRFVAAVDRFMG